MARSIFLIKYIFILIRDPDFRFKCYLAIACLLAIPAFLIHLGSVPFIGDEAIRSLVAFEMMKSGNYLAPSMMGDFYFAKPPLYNWILSLSFTCFGEFDEYAARFPTVIFSFLFTVLIWYFNKDKFKSNPRFAILVALMFLSCGRMIFYDTMLGLIDIFFSMVIYTMVLLLWEYGSKGQFTKVYVTVYSLGLVGFMLKGFPVLHFMFFGLGIIHFLFGNWANLRKRAHLLSSLIFIGGLSFYFLLYEQYHSTSKALDPLLHQATLRTVVYQKTSTFFLHLVTYPFENIFHFLPWSLMGLLVFQKKIIDLLKKDTYIWYMVLSCASNFAIYWLSPQVYPRYILMLIPMAFTVWLYLYQYELGRDTKIMKVISIMFKITAIAIPFFIIYKSNHPLLVSIENYKKIISIFFVVTVVILVAYFYDKYNRIIIFLILIFTLRLSFDLLILPIRAKTGDDEYFKREAQRVGGKYKDLKLFGKSKMDWINAFYISVKTNKITNRSINLEDASFFIIDSSYMHTFEKIDSFPNSYDCATLWVIKGKKNQ